jgi:nicotinamide riboside transporter PnuC
VQALLPLVLMTTVFDICPKILILALICSVAGLIVNGYLRAGIPYGQVLTMAVYATAPACLATLLALSLLLYAEMPGGQWVLAVPFVVGMAYTGLATWRTATELGSQGTQGAPPL